MNLHRHFPLLLLLLCAAGCAGSGVATRPPAPAPSNKVAEPPAEDSLEPAEPAMDDAEPEAPAPEAPSQDVLLLRFKGTGKDLGTMTQSALVAVDPQGFVYTADAGRVLRFTPEGKFASGFSTGEPPCQPTGLAADRGGIVYVACGGRLLRYEGASGKLLGEVRHPDGAGFFHVAPRPDSGVLASWRNAQRDDFVLVAFDGTIETIHRNAVAGASGQAAGDVLVAMDGRRTIYAAVNPLHAVCVFKLTGEYVNRFGSEGEDPDQFSGPFTGLAVDGQGQIFVSDAKGVSALLGEDGRFLRRLETKGTGLAIDDDDALFAAAGTEVAKYRVEPPPKKE